VTPGLRPRLVEALRGRACPVIFADDDVIPAASLWIGSRHWVNAFRAAGLRPGDRLVLALPASAPFVQVLIAALWEGLTVAPVPAGSDPETMLDELDARVAVVAQSSGALSGILDVTGRPGPGSGRPGVWTADGVSGPARDIGVVRRATQPRTPEAALLLSTSGTTGRPRWIALSDRNVCAVLDSHQPRFGLSGAYVVSVLPWHHAFGLILDLLPALLAGSYIARDPQCGRDPLALAALLRRAPAVLSAVPHTITMLAALDDGEALLAGLAGGTIGGAQVSNDLAAMLERTALRVGYGQTEASPGIALGEPGRWKAGLLGRPVGCEVRLVDGALEFRGENACIGEWGAGGFVQLDPGRWVATGDAVEQIDGELFYRGRVVNNFKLANGRWIETSTLEPAIREALQLATDVVLFTAAGSTLDVVVVLPADRAWNAGAQHEAIRRALGHLGDLLGHVHLIDPAAVVRDTKGAIDRRATVEQLRG